MNKSFLIRGVAYNIIEKLYNSKHEISMADIYRNSEYSLSQTVIVIKRFVEFGVLTKKREDRRLMVKLTEKGKEIAKHFISIGVIMNERTRSV